ncbi:NAD(P)-dependent oxidoreductase [Sphingopyxis sp.]|uniref:NAD(P)-dependent oxidoreductase n=1 Tax=Sphingopyxis sp. TaxID=1908224 RepID=UPI002D78323A|nr:NAD(P)-binding domain-containing protein [Sphingopyxis sp.]HET6526728.1 NAD(P)-binding domain-containing protein [Sphingopyxis sp.]
MREQNNGSSDFDVSVLGLGAMGTIIARTLTERGKRVAVWNRSPGKAEGLRASGVHICDTAEDALRASPVSILVLLNSEVARETLGALCASGALAGRALCASGALAGRTIVNYSSGSAEEGEELQKLVAGAGARLVKGTIMSYPRNIGHPESYCIHTGDPGAFEDHRELLELLAGHAIFLPWKEAYALATAINAQTFTAMLSFFEVAGAAHRMGLPVRQMARQINDASRFFAADAIEDALCRFEGAGFAGDQATIDVHEAGFTYIREYMRSQGASTPIFDAVCEVVRRAQREGHGEADIAATTKIFAPAEAFTE